MDSDRHHTDSALKYKLYFDLLHNKMKEYGTEPCLLYNMDKKGYLVGVIGRSKQVFIRHQWKKKEAKAALQDSNRG